MRWSQINSKISVLIPAAGQGKRMESSVKKPYLMLDDKPILSHTIDRFEQNSVIDEIFVIVDQSDFTVCRENALTPFRYRKVRELVAGGETRQASVFNGLRALSDDVDFVVVHDGVRPFIDDKIIFECLEAAAEWGSAVSAVPVKETIKVANEELFVDHTPQREQLWQVQTPQVFRKSLIVEAHKKAIHDRIDAPDDAALVENLGSPIKLVMGSYKNVKLTTPEDLRIAETLLNDEI
ncbi:MAG: 2-C-methyl-D-erythritol 4-phosphate cytidylyltransferase [Candidatus Poribacteria bacterium]|nr:2-C-methyl-D-erythritol 4-phosphate cytidylyltransferase [Candidatus Poribacteria bacterium]